MDNVFDKLSSLKSHSYSMPQLESMDSIQVGTSTYSVSKTEGGFSVERDNIPEGPTAFTDWRGARGAIVKCGVWRSCSSLLMSLHFFHSIDEANIFHYIS